MPRRAPQVPGGEPIEQSGAAPENVSALEVAQAAAESLPNEADIDPTKIRRPVLTKTGWVCPATSPAPPVKE